MLALLSLGGILDQVDRVCTEFAEKDQALPRLKVGASGPRNLVI